jgi:hypothetical protein
VKAKPYNIKRLLLKTYFRYYNVITLNKNLVISGIVGLAFSIIISHLLVDYAVDPVINSALTVTVGFIAYKTIFALLFHNDNKKNYTRKLSGKYSFRLLRHIWIRIILVSSVFDSINNVTRFILMIQLLNSNYSAIESTTISSVIASLISYISINLVVKYTRLYYLKK